MSKLLQTRRGFLAALGTGAATLPLISLPGFAQGADPASMSGKRLILIELSGGNDGLNTVVPIRDPAYRALRPQIGISAQDVLGLDGDTGLHPALRGLAGLWEQGDVQIVEGVGYPDPNRSHFRSIEIWNEGLGATGYAHNGWIASAFDQSGAPTAQDADGLILGGTMGPLKGRGRFSAMRDEGLFMETVENLSGAMHPVRPLAAQSPLDHVLATYENARATGQIIRRKLEASRARQWDFPFSSIGEQLRTAARLIDAGVDVPVIKVSHEGYDTHDAQEWEHQALLEELSAAIHAFSGALRDMGQWDDTVIVTYSEFGRTAHENASGGTDHGTAAPVFVIGGGVTGGLSGGRPSLDQLVDNDLQYTTDYRTVYHALLSDLWGIDAPHFAVGGATPLSVLG